MFTKGRIPVVDTMEEAFDLCRERNKPMQVIVRQTRAGSTLWKVFPSGKAEQAFPPSAKRDLASIAAEIAEWAASLHQSWSYWDSGNGLVVYHQTPFASFRAGR